MHTWQRVSKLRLYGMMIQRLPQNVHPLVQVRYSLYMTIHRSNESRQLMPLVFLDVVFEGLEDGIVRVLDEVCLTGCHGPAEVMLGKVSPGLGIRGVHRVMF